MKTPTRHHLKLLAELEKSKFRKIRDSQLYRQIMLMNNGDILVFSPDSNDYEIQKAKKMAEEIGIDVQIVKAPNDLFGEIDKSKVIVDEC